MFNFANVDWKKLGIIAGFILLVILLAYLLYLLFFAPVPVPGLLTPEPGSVSQLPSPTTGTQPGLTQEEKDKSLNANKPVTKIPAEKTGYGDLVANGGITQVKDLDYGTTANITLAPSGNELITYNPDSGEFAKINEQGIKTPFSTQIYKNVKNLSWAPQKDKAVLEFPDGSNVLYDFKNEKQVTLPKNWAEFDFNQGGNRIAFKNMTPLDDYKFVGVANPDGSGFKYLDSIGSEYLNVKVMFSPNQRVVATFKSPNTGDTTNLLFLGQNGENIKSITMDGYGLDMQWTPSSNKLLYSAYNQFSSFKPLLHIVDADGSDNNGANHRSLDLNTWANKCTFADDSTVYCAVPKELPTGADFDPRIADDTPDYIYRVDLNTGSKSFVAEPSENHTIANMVVSEDKSTLFFTDKTTQTLHSIRLK